VLFCDVGFPKIIQSDNGTEFVNAIITALIDTAHIERRLITAYNPRANGLAERFVQSASQVIYKQLEGKASDWDLYHSAAQFHINNKISTQKKSTPYSLLFARPVNGFSNYSTIDSDLLSEDELTRRLEYMTKVVYPELANLTGRHLDWEGGKFAKGNKLSLFQPGAVVMAIDELRTSKSQPRYTGPFFVVRRTKGGSYVLKGPDETEYRRPPHALKLVSPDIVQEGTDDSIAAVVDRILDHKIDEATGSKQYLVAWDKRPTEFNQWVKESDFHDLGPIQKYWKNREPPAAKPRKRVRFTLPQSRRGRGKGPHAQVGTAQ
jgi:hypothetical protein